MDTEVYKIIENIINGKGLTIAEAARRCDLPDSTMRGIISRKQKSIALEVAFKIASGLDVSLSVLNGIEELPTISKPETTSKESPKKYPLLNEAGKEKVDSYIDGLLESRDFQLNPEPVAEIDIEVMGRAPAILIDFYDAPVSAGLGEMLMDEEKIQISVPDTPTTQQADFCLRVKGDSMEPKYFDGDLVFVESREAIEEGQIGIFVFDGEAYIKKYTHDGLVSLNKKYDDIIPDEETRVYCFGRVIGKI